SLVRIDQTCLAKSGGFAPISFPLFQAVRFREIEFSFFMAILIGWGDAHDAPACPGGPGCGGGLRVPAPCFVKPGTERHAVMWPSAGRAGAMGGYLTSGVGASAIG